MAGQRKSARTAQTTVPMQGKNPDSGHAASCPMNPFCSAEFAVIAEHYEQLSDRISELRIYLKEEYLQAIDHRLSAQAIRIE